MTPQRPALTGRRAARPVCMLTHSYYEEDPRVRREAESLVAAGRPVEVFALRRPSDPPEGQVDGVALHRLDTQRHQGAGLATYATEYLTFFARATVAMTLAHRRARFALIQVHTLPDFLVFAGLHFRLAGIPLVLDLHEAMPEFFRMRFPGTSHPLVQRLMRLQEKVSIVAADAVLTVNEALAGRLERLGVPASKITVVLNSPDLVRFDPGRFPRRAFMADGVLRLAYAGALTPTYELDVVIEAMAHLRQLRPDLAVTLDAYGRGDARTRWRAAADAIGVGDAVRFHGRIPIEEVPLALARADIGLAPTRRSDFTDYSLSTKIFEYGAMGKPAIASRLPLVQETFSEGSVATYEPGDAADLAAKIARLVDEPLEREARIARTGSRVRELSWANESARYLGLIEGLIRARATDSPAGPSPVGGRHRAPTSQPTQRADASDKPPVTAPGDTAEAEPVAAYSGRP